jgi:hypothetical protein
MPYCLGILEDKDVLQTHYSGLTWARKLAQ